MPSTAQRRAATAVFDETGCFFERSHELLATATPDGDFRRVNSGWTDQLGYEESELTGHSLVEFVHPGDVERTRGEIAKLAAGAESVGFENHLRARDGTYHWLRWAADIARGVVYVVARDVTTQRVRALSVADEQAYHLGLAEASARGFITLDSELLIRDVNEKMCQMVGRSRAGMVGAHFGELIVERERGLVEMRRAIAEGLVSGCELTFQGPDGRPIPASCNFGVFRDAAGEVAGVLAGIRDTTAQRALQGSLLAAASYTRSLIESSVDPMMTTDADGVITDVNRQMELLTACGREALIGSPFRDHITEPTLADQGIERAFRDGRVTNLELTARALDGGETVVSYNAATFADSAGTVQGVVATARDISDFKRLEHELRDMTLELAERVKELEVSNAELHAFSYSVSHDLRAPLRAIDGFSRIVIEDDGGTLTDSQRRYLDLVRDNTQVMGTLIDELLAFSRLASQPLNRTTVHTAELVAALQSEVEADEPGRIIEFTNGVLPTVQADPGLLRQVFANLLANAVKYSRQRETARITVASETRDGELVFLVGDNGVGFDMRYSDKLFQVFQRLHRAEDYEGTGVGLAIVQRIVARHGGRVWAQGQPDQGATFYFTLEGRAP